MVIKSRWVRWVTDVACMRKMRNFGPRTSECNFYLLSYSQRLYYLLLYMILFSSLMNHEYEPSFLVFKNDNKPSFYICFWPINYHTHTHTEHIIVYQSWLSILSSSLPPCKHFFFFQFLWHKWSLSSIKSSYSVNSDWMPQSLSLKAS